MRPFRTVWLATALVLRIASLANAQGGVVFATPSPLPSGTVGVPYSTTITVNQSVTWTATGMPAGLTINPAAGTTTTISGTPTVSGVFSNVVITANRSGLNTSQAYSVTINSVTSLGASLVSPSLFGKQLTLTATLAPTAATGQVVFYDGVNQLGAGVLSAGHVSLTTRVLASGTHKLKAVYLGDGTNTASTSSVIAQVVRSVLQNGFLPAAGFTNVPQSGSAGDPSSAALGDFNEDGIVDVAVANFQTNNVSIFRGLGGGTFSQPTVFPSSAGGGASAIAIGDFDGDGHLDLAVANFGTTSSTVSILIGDGRGSFAAPVDYQTTSVVGGAPTRPSAVAIGDTDGDDIPDIVVANFGTNSVAVLRGAGDGTFLAATGSRTFAVGTNPSALLLGDFDGNGHTDIAVANSGSNNVSVLMGQGSGRFANAVTYSTGVGGPHSMAAADFDGDGNLDLAVVNITGSANILHGSATGVFTAGASLITGSSPNFIAAGDFNGDGNLDLVTANAGSNTLSLFLGNGGGGFGTATTYNSAFGHTSPYAVAVGDFNLDGISDLFVPNFASNDVNVFLGLAATATSLNISPNPIQFTDLGTLTATVTTSIGSTPTGTATFFDNGIRILSAVALNASGVATLTNVASGSVGSHPITAVYSGDSANATSTSSSSNLIVSKDNTTTTVTGNPNPSGVGQNATLTATVVPQVGVNVATGTVQFKDGGANLGGPQTLSGGGVGTLVTAALTAGPHSITAIYSGDQNDLTSTSLALTQNVAIATSTKLSTTRNPATLNQAVTLSVQVVPTGGTGTVTFKDGATTIGSPAALDPDGLASVQASFSTTGAHNLTATYSGDASFAGSQDTLSQNVVPSTITSLSASPATAFLGQAVTLTATVLPSGATGTVVFFDGATMLGSGTLTGGGTASLSTPLIGSGARKLRALYSGSASFGASASTLLSKIISGRPQAGFGAPVTYPTGPQTITSVVGDFNGDGKQDLAALDLDFTSQPETGIVTILLGNGDGTFGVPQHIVAGSDPDDLAVGDFNGDGKTDLAFADHSNGVIILTGDGAGNFTVGSDQFVGPSVTRLAVADYNNDGIADLAFGSSSGVYVELGLGDGTFDSLVQLASSEGTSTPKAVDMNSDGNADLVWLQPGGTMGIALGNGDGTFNTFKPSTATPNTYQPGSGLVTFATADFTGDGNLDVVVGTQSGNVLLLPGNGDGTLGAATTIPVSADPEFVAGADADGDGNQDIIVLDRNSGLLSVVPGLGNGSFGAITTTDTGLAFGSSGLTVGDFSGGTGRVDISIPNSTTDDVTVLLGLPANILLSCPMGSTPVVNGVAYSLTCTGSNGIAPYSYAQPTGTIPPGLALSGLGVISGTPTQTGSFSFTVKATDSDVPPQSLTVNLTLNVAPPLVISSSPLPAAPLNAAYSNTLVSGGTPPYTCGRTAGSFPTGLTFNSATCTLSGTPTVAGASSFTLSVSDSGSPPQTGSPAFSLTIQQTSTATGLTSSVNPTAFGASTTLTATVTPATSGTVTFKDGATALGPPVTLVGGVAALAISSLSGGGHSLTAVYNGDTNDAGSTSSPLTQTVNQSTSTTSLGVVPSPSLVGQNTTLTANVTPAGATGTVTFKDGSVAIGSPVAIVSGAASVSTAALTAGSHSLTAVYNGETNYSGSTSPVVTQLVRNPASISLAISPAAPVFGQPSTITVNMFGGSPLPAGRVTFYDGTTVLGTSVLNGSGLAVLVTPLLASGPRSLTAYYQGSTTYTPVKSAPITSTVKTFAESGFAAATPQTIGPNTRAVAVGDFDQDGIQDIAAGNYNGSTTNQVSILSGNGDGTFRAPVNYDAGSPVQAIAIADLNGDGFEDLILATPGTNGVTVLLGTGGGAFGAPSTFSASGVLALAVADFNNDGLADIVVGNTNGVRILQGNGDGTFQPAVLVQSTSGPTYVTAADFNSDGSADIAAVDSNGTVYIQLGNGNGTFQSGVLYATSVSPISISATDLNNDANPDVILGDDGGGVRVLLGSATGMLASAVSYTAGLVPGFVATGDFNGDGKVDMAVADLSSARVSVLAGNGDGSFQTNVDYVTASPVYAIAAGNFRGGNGRADLVVGYGPVGDIGVLLSQIPQVSIGCTPGAPPVLTGITYTITCTGSGGVPAYTYSQPTGTLPPGLTLTSSTGVITGQPTTPGGYTFSIQAADNDTPVQTATKTVVVTVVTPLIMSATPLPAGTVNSGYTTTVASGGTPPYTCGLSVGAYPTGLTMDGTTCVLSGTPSVPGTFPFTVGVSDSGNPQQNATRTFSLTIQQITTTTGLTSTLNPSTFGTSVSLTGTVSSAIATGSMTIFDNGTSIGSGAVSGGSFAVVTTALSTLTHPLTASYSGDVNFLPSTSAVLNQVVNPDPTTTTLTSSANPSVFGDNVTFTATISIGAATGTVTFKEGSNTLGTGTVTGGVATFLTTSLAAGAHSITAVYGGDTNDATSTSSVFSQTVKAVSTTTLTSSSTPSTLGTPVILTATVAPGAASGKVTFYNGTTVIGTGTIASGQATFTTSLLPAAADNLRAYYSGDGANTPSISAGITQTVNAGTEAGLRGPVSIPGTSNQPVSMAIGDFNHDGIADLVTADSSGGLITVLLGTNGGAYTRATYTVGTNPSAVAVADFNADGIADLAVANFTSNSVSILLGVGDGTFGVASSVPVAGNPVSVAVADFNHDGFADLAVVSNSTDILTVLPGTGTGAFGAANILTTGAGPSSVAAGDFNNDGFADLVVANKGGNTLTVRLNSGSGAFGEASTLTAGSAPASVIVADFNKDGNADIAVANSAGASVGVFYGNGSTFTAMIPTTTGTGPVGLAAGDFNGDGIVDVAVSNAGDSTIQVFPVDGNGLLGLPVTYPAGANPSALAAGDLNGDGRTDLAVADTGGNDESLFLGLAVSTTTLTSSLNPSTFGTTVTFTATVTPAGVTGTVTFVDGTTSIGTGTVSGGTAALLTSALVAGGHPITASYGGDNNNGVSTSAAVNQTVNKAASATTLTSSLAPSTFGASVIFTATVSVGATGTVTFFDGATSIGSGTLIGGTATLTTASLSVATHSITASYGGDANFLTSVSPAFSEVVNKAPTTTTLTAAPNPSTFGQAVTLTATVVPSSSTGTVTFFDGATSLGTGVLNSSGIATLTVSTLSVAAHSLTASYPGDSNDTASTSSAVSQTVSKGSTTTTLTSSLSPSTLGDSVTLTATLSVNTASGTVTFLDGATSLGTGTVAGGTATLTLSTLAGGTHSLTASYGGDNSFNGSVSSVFSQVVNPIATTVTLISSLNPSTSGQTITLKATLSQAAATGTVTFNDGPTSIGSASVSAGIATLPVSGLTIGTHSLTASYGGDADYAVSASSVFSQAVRTPSSTTLSSSAAGGSTLGSAVTLTANISPGDASGKVAFFDGVSMIGTASIKGSQASITTRQLASGTRSLRAFYLGSAAYGPGASNVLSEAVNAIPQNGFAPNVGYTVGPNTPASAVADFNADGFPDLVVATYNSDGFGSVNILLNNGDGTFQPAAGYSSGAAPLSIATGDFDGDGVPDVVVAVPATNSLNVLLSNGQGIPGTFFPVADANGPESVVVGDFNGDGNADLAAGNADGTVSIFLGGGNASFVPVPTFGSGGSPASLVLADFNGDHIADLGMTDAAGFHVLLGNGDGTFAQVFESLFTGGLSAAVGDFNGDGIPDVVVAGGAAVVAIPGAGDGTFGQAVSYPAGSNVTSVVTGDFNGDGLQDFAAGDIEVGNLVVFLGNGAGAFNAPANYHGNVVGLSVADFNGDGRTDIGAGDGTSGDAGVFLGSPAVPSVGCGPQNLPAILGSPYSLNCGAVSGVPPYTFSISQGALPDGLSVDLASGTISGTPTVAGNFTFVLAATDSQSPPLAGSATLSILATTQLTMATPRLPGGSANAGYLATLAAGGTAPYTCTLTGGTLPPGLTLTPSTCVLSGATTTLGTFVFGIQTADSGAPVQTASQSFSLVVSQFASSTTLSSSPNPSVTGQQVTVNISVTAPNAAGNVTILDGASIIGTPALANGVAQAQFSGLAIGSHSLTATYPGDMNNTASTSAAVIQVVNLIPTTTGLSSSLNPSAFGDSVTLTASILPATATGTVTFKDGAATVGSGNVNSNGVATLISSTIPVGTHLLSATYNGDATMAASTSSPALPQTVHQAAITTGLTSSLTTSHFGENVTLTATVSVATATGSVTFLDGATTIGTGNVNSNGVATLVVSTLTVGLHSLTASYSGDASYLGNTSPAVSQTVIPAITTTTLTAVPNPSTFRQPVTLTITVTPSTATGTVTVSDSTIPVGNPVTLVNGSATFAFPDFSVGLHSLTAAYSGDANDAASVSAVVNQNVNLGLTTTILTSSLNPALPNQAVTFTATIFGAGANGSITFSDGGTPLGGPIGYDGAPLSFTTSSLTPGPHTITATYSGDSNFASSVSSLIRSPLNFSAAAPGTILDSNGQGTGFTTRLPGTGGSLAGNDPNLTLNTATGTLGLTSTAADLNNQVNLGVGEYLGVPLSSIGVTNNEDFAVIGTFHNLQYSESFDQLGLFAGPSSTTALRGGNLVVAPTPSVFTTQTVNGVDGSLQTDPVLAPAAGDDVTLTMSRTNGVWRFLVEDLTNPAKTGSVAVDQPTYLNGLSTLVAGVFAANPGGSPKDETVTAFALAVPVQTIGTLASTTTLTSSVTPSIVGNSITLTAAVTPSDATGTVTFLDADATIGTGNLADGTATLDISTLAFGDHQLTAVYGGDSITAESTSIALKQTVNFTGLTITTTSLPGGAAGGTYGPVTLQAGGGSGNFTWSATGLPPGITLSAGGILSGASAAFIGSVNITVTDTTSSLTASQAFQLTVSAPEPPPVAPVAPLVIGGPGDLGEVTAGGTVSGNFSASGGTPPYAWTLSGASAGFGVDANGHVTGNPTAVGNAAVSVTVTDSRSASKQTSATYSVFGFTTSSLPGGTATVSYSGSVGVGGGTAPYTFSATGVPAGLTFSGGAFSGKPETAGNYPVSIQVNDSRGLSVTRGFSISVAAAPPPTTTPSPLQISSISLPDGVVSQPYSQTLAATGGSPAYTWTQTGGKLPDGVSLTPGGTVSGLAGVPGVYSVGVQVTDTAGGKVAAAVALNIVPARLQITTAATLPSGIANVDYPAQTLTATGGVAPYQFSVTGSLPGGLTLLDGQISGTPTATGAFSFILKVTDSSTPPASGTLAMTVTIRPNSADLILSSGGVSFSLVSGAAGAPDAGAVTVSSSDVSQVLNYSVSAGSAPWLSVTAATSTPGNVFIGLSNAALALTAAGSPYSATVVVTCTSAVCSGKAQAIGVTLTVQNSPPEMSVDSALLSFGAASLNPQASTASFVIQNTGGGSLKITSVSGADPWLSVGAFPSTLSPGPGARVSVTATPGSLPPGFYLSALNVSTGAGSTSIPVTLLIASDSSMNLGPAGSQFSMPQGGALGKSSGSFLVSVSKAAPVSFSAAVLPGAFWLTSSNGGVASIASPGSVSYSLNPAAIAALPAGAYYGTIRVSATGIVNTPQDFQVVLSISPASTPVVPDPQPAGLLFLSAKPGPQAPQTIQVYASSTRPLAFQASASMADGAGWLSLDTSTGSAIAGTPGKILASVDSTGLKAGVYRGSVGFSAGSAVRTVNVTLVVEPTASDDSPSSSLVTRAKPAADGPVCAGATLVATQTGLVTNFSAPASWPTPLAIKLVDSCGSIVGNGQIVATFSNGDPPLELSPVDVPNGLYSGTWTPRKTASQITISAHATVPGYATTSIQIAGKVTPNAAPQLAPNGTLDVFHPQVGAGLGPGNIVQIYGSSLASQTTSPQVLPLPTEVEGTQVLIGGVASPLFYISPGQVNAQIPFELEAGKQYQVIVSANGALTTPQPIQLNAGAPSVLQFTSGLIVAQHQDAAATLISDAAPARPGEYIVLYMSGLGATDIPVSSGQPSPANPPANVLDTPLLTLNGQPVPLLFAGLTPSLVGLYQINVQIPQDLADGTYDMVVSQSGVISNTTSLPVKK